MNEFIENKAGSVRKHYYSTEYYLLVGAAIYLTAALFLGKLLAFEFQALLFSVSSFYSLGRMTAKKNRGRFESGIVVSEFQAVLVQWCFALFFVLRGAVDYFWGGVFLIAPACLYFIVRGITKSRQGKTTVLIR